MISIEPKSIIRKNKVSFSSTINPDQRETLERIFFYNKNQSEYYFDIKHLIESYGQPRIVEENDRLYLNIGKIDRQNILLSWIII